VRPFKVDQEYPDNTDEKMLHEQLSGKNNPVLRWECQWLRPGLDENSTTRNESSQLNHRGHSVQCKSSSPRFLIAEELIGILSDLILENAVIVDPKVSHVSPDTYVAK